MFPYYSRIEQYKYKHHYNVAGEKLNNTMSENDDHTRNEKDIPDTYFFNRFISENFSYNTYNFCKKELKHSREYMYFLGNRNACIVGVLPYDVNTKQILGTLYIDIHGIQSDAHMKPNKLYDRFIRIIKRTYRFGRDIQKIILYDHSTIRYSESLNSLQDAYVLKYGTFYYVKQYSFSLYDPTYDKHKLYNILKNIQHKYQHYMKHYDLFLKLFVEKWSHKIKKTQRIHIKSEMEMILSFIPFCKNLTSFFCSYTFKENNTYRLFVDVVKQIIRDQFMDYHRDFGFILTFKT